MEIREIERELERLALDLEESQEALRIVQKESAEIINKMCDFQELLLRKKHDNEIGNAGKN